MLLGRVSVRSVDAEEDVEVDIEESDDDDSFARAQRAIARSRTPPMAPSRAPNSEEELEEEDALEEPEELDTEETERSVGDRAGGDERPR